MESVWHYTTAGGLRSIVQSGTLWATSHRFMNDSREPEHATRVLSRIAGELGANLDPDSAERLGGFMAFGERRGLEAFLLCAAREPDLLTIWRAYGGEVPYAIELDAQVKLFPVQQRLGCEHPSPPAGWEPEYDEVDGERYVVSDPDDLHVEIEGWMTVDYDDGDARARVEALVQLARSTPDRLRDALTPYMNLAGVDLLRLKDAAFVDEREARMAFSVRPRWKFVQFRASRFGLTPYIEVSAADDDNRGSIDESFVLKAARQLPIRSVHIGPSPVGEESVLALREFLEFSGYPDIEIQRSRAPLR